MGQWLAGCATNSVLTDGDDGRVNHGWYLVAGVKKEGREAKEDRLKRRRMRDLGFSSGPKQCCFGPAIRKQQINKIMQTEQLALVPNSIVHL